VNHVSKARILYVLGTFSVLAFHFGCFFKPGGLSDGGFW
jgi:hypothetical protein